ncbi:hypothetical protein ACWDRR_00710 [Kitasatospora sp. NPDC003701]
MKELIRQNPVRVRAAVVALVGLLASVVPALAGVDVELIAGPLVAAVALWAGQSAGKRVVLTEAAEMRQMEAAQSCCDCVHAEQPE